MFFKKVRSWTRRRLPIKITAIVLIILGFVFWPNIKENMASLISGAAGMAPAPGITTKDTVPDYLSINHFIDHAPTLLPKNLIKAIAWCESQWKHYNGQGEPLMGINLVNGPWGNDYSYDWGLMQINDGTVCLDPRVWDFHKIKNDQEYNILAGIAVLEQKKDYIEFLKHRPNWGQVVRRYHLEGRDEMDILIKAYNGFQPSWAYVNHVRTLMRERPWEKMMAAQLDHTYPGSHTEFGGILPTVGPALLPEADQKPSRILLEVMPRHCRPFYALSTTSRDKH